MCRRVLLLIFALLCASSAFAGEIRLSAAASLTDALGEICARYAEIHPDVKLFPNFAGSGTLARQIVSGAPADFFISANPKWMSYLVEEKRVAGGKVKPLARNALVFVGRKGLKIASPKDLLRLRRIAIGSPGSVPAGQYAEEALSAAGVYGKLAAEGKLVMAQDVRQALIYADRGEVDGAFVYRTDALLAKKAVILYEVPAALHAPITYPMGLTVQGEKNPEAVEFFRFLQSPEAEEVLGKYGFIVL